MWFDIIKVEDIDFDNAIEAFGYYTAETKDMDFDEIMMLAFSGESLKYKDVMDEKIRINPALSYEYLKDKLDREPTEKDIATFIIRIIMHEGTHAGMGEEQLSMAPHQAEYGAYVGQFPESTYLRLKRFVKHPAGGVNFLPPMIQSLMGIRAKHTFRTTEKLENIITFVDGITSELPSTKQTGEIREQLTRLEIKARQEGKPEISEINIEHAPTMKDRYGAEAFDALYDMIAEEMDKVRATVKDGDLEKVVGAVSTTSAPALFNVKYSDKEDEKDAR